MEILESRVLTTYSITRLPIIPTDINDAGVIVGYAGDNAYSWNGEIKLLGQGIAHSINTDGVIAGTTDVGRVKRAVVWDDEVILLHPIRELNSSSSTINDLGQVVGQSLDLGETWATIWNNNIPNHLGKKFSTVHDINNLGQAVGVNGLPLNAMGVIWDGTNTIELGTLGWQGSVGTAINESTHVVGWSHILYQFNADWLVSVAHPFLWKEGEIQDIGTLPCGTNKAAYAVAKDINENGEIVGFSGCVGLFEAAQDTAAIWKDGIKPLRARGWELKSATAINNSGQIVGAGIYNGKVEGYLLSPLYIDPDYAMKFKGVFRGNRR